MASRPLLPEQVVHLPHYPAHAAGERSTAAGRKSKGGGGFAERIYAAFDVNPQSAAVGGAPATGEPPTFNDERPGFQSLPGFKVPRQEQENWCWAAVACGVAQFRFNCTVPPPSQSVIATVALRQRTVIAPLEDCWGNGVAKCDCPSDLERALRSTGTLGRSIPNIVEFEVVAKEIRDGRPLPIYLGAVGVEIGHFVCISGVSADDAAEQRVLVYDPSTGSVDDIAFSDLLSGTRERDPWTHTYTVCYDRRPVALADLWRSLIYRDE